MNGKISGAVNTASYGILKLRGFSEMKCFCLFHTVQFCI